MRRNASRAFWLAVSLATLSLGSSIFGAGLPAQTLNLPEGGIIAVQDDDETPDVTARVARISFIHGDVRIRRVGSDDWEKAVLNLPLIEGDEISTGVDARLEMQFNNYVHVRLDHDAYLKFSVMKDEGVAVSLSEGTMNVRISDLEKAGGYFEIDAPKTTVAIEKSGSYRVDAGKAGDPELHVSVTGGGSARVYSENAGFTLKSGRGARVFIDGANTGEWETAEAAKFGDEFDTWASDRDATIAKRLSDAYYDKYYDQDIYGADDLNGYGDWVYTSTYGYVWRPYNTSLSGYADWSPYRYGHWRWLGAYGWTWVNDEPWGWATYHHGRWIYDSGYWAWSPYGFYRPKRSWWFPALVVINIINTNICWYPLGYHHRWQNYYNGHHGGGGWIGNGNGNGTGSGNGNGHNGPPVATTNPPAKWIDQLKKGKKPQPGDDNIPTTGVIMVDKKDFGVKTRGTVIAPPIIAKAVLEKKDTAIEEVKLPDRRQIDTKTATDILLNKPDAEAVAVKTRTGAAPRQSDRPLDAELKSTRILGGRQTPPIVPVIATPSAGDTSEKRRTGAVERPPVRPKVDETKSAEPVTTVREEPIRRPKVDPPRIEPAEKEKPRIEPVIREKPRESPPYVPPVRELPKTDPPARQPQPRNDPPKSEPKPVEKAPVEKPRVVESKKDPKDGR